MVAHCRVPSGDDHAAFEKAIAMQPAEATIAMQWA
jgi:hypothetical protein